ncbi:hypothetical protein P692DRAFT_20880825 [Suillus brevipes Sb2]|nr:hypothetical protein P692DRAFT_20880825 [Suillus brevipes Sb2]
MANLIRSPKSGSDWTSDLQRSHANLMAYNITAAPQLPEHFFRQNPWRVLIRCSLIPILMLSNENISDAIFEDLGQLNLATNPTQESFMDAFARETLHILGFVERGLIINPHHSIPLRICSDEHRVAQTDVCLLDMRLMILLVLPADKTVFYASHPESQIPLPLDAMTTLLHASLWLTLDPSSILSLSPKLSAMRLRLANIPKLKQWCVTFLGYNRRVNEWTETQDYRRVAFERFLAFKALAKEYWQTFIV